MNPLSRRELIRRLRRLGFEGPFSGGRHSFMRQGQLKIRVPNPHQSDISASLIKEILKQAGISQREWDDAE
ncbi:MAG: type II toxin-antitoxin system HicA family toxin [Clostridia bacterium]|nr:MAG: type II toxin-antitoxin system HicA family toxin [Clostridia bacterium]